MGDGGHGGNDGLTVVSVADDGIQTGKFIFALADHFQCTDKHAFKIIDREFCFHKRK